MLWSQKAIKFSPSRVQAPWIPLRLCPDTPLYARDSLPKCPNQTPSMVFMCDGSNNCRNYNDEAPDVRGQLIVKTRNPKVIREKPQCHPSRESITMPQSPPWLLWDAYMILPQNCHFPFDNLHSHLIHPFLDRLHSDPVSHFAKIHTPLSQTYRQTDLCSIDCIVVQLIMVIHIT